MTIYRKGNLLSKRKRTERIGQLLVLAAGAAQALAGERLEPFGLSPRAWGVLSTLVESGPPTQPIDSGRDELPSAPNASDLATPQLQRPDRSAQVVERTKGAR